MQKKQKKDPTRNNCNSNLFQKETGNYTKDLFENIAMDWFVSTSLYAKESTQNKYRNMLSYYILPVYGQYPIQQITTDFIEQNCQLLLASGGKQKAGLSSKTVTDVLSIVRNILRFASKKGISISCDGNAVKIKHMPNSIRVLSKSEQDKLCRYLLENSTPYSIGILICLFTGMRVGEICALRWEDISFPDQTIHVCHTMQRIQNHSDTIPKTKIIITPPKSACSNRIIPINDKLCKILSIYKSTDTGFVLTNSEKFIEPRSIQAQFKRILKKNYIDSANFHAIRHTFATRCIELGFDVKSLSEILGHASINITMNRYVHPTLELKKENMNKLDSLFDMN